MTQTSKTVMEVKKTKTKTKKYNKTNKTKHTAKQRGNNMHEAQIKRTSVKLFLWQ